MAKALYEEDIFKALADMEKQSFIIHGNDKLVRYEDIEIILYKLLGIKREDDFIYEMKV